MRNFLKTNSGARSFRKSSQKIEFEYFAPDAQSVKVAGAFNEWNADALPLKKSRDGKWKGSVQLSSGRYEYRYFVDGLWENDQRPVECVPNPFGTWNCVLEIR